MDAAARAVTWLGGLFERLEMSVELAVEEDDEQITVSVTGKDAELLLADMSAAGPAVLLALQNTVQAAIFGGRQRRKQILIDAANYRQRRMEMLQDVANRLSDKVVQTGDPVTLLGMSSFDRRAIHQGVRDKKGVKTESEGFGHFRRLKVSPRS